MTDAIEIVIGWLTIGLGLVGLIRHMGGWRAVLETRAYLSLLVFLGGWVLAALLHLYTGSTWGIIVGSLISTASIATLVWQLRKGRVGRFLIAFDKAESAGLLQDDPAKQLPATTPDGLKALQARLEELRYLWEEAAVLAIDTHQEKGELIERDLNRVAESLRLSPSSRPNAFP